MDLNLIPHATGDKYLFTPVTTDSTGVFELAVPDENWSKKTGSHWTMMTCAETLIPEQGWKVHVSCIPKEATKMLQIVSDYCFAEKVSFKYLTSMQVLRQESSKYAGRTSAAKFFTIYPESDAQSATIAADLANLTEEFQAPYILSDLQWGDTPVHLRYGGFKRMMCECPETGHEVPAIRHPNGKLVPDQRKPYFNLPEWVEVPDAFKKHYDRYLSDEFELPFTMLEPIHFSSAGGVYVAEYNGEVVVVKEARSLAGISADDTDAIYRLRKEKEALSALQGRPGVPRFIAYERVWRHEYLIMEKVDGDELHSWLAQSLPRVFIRHVDQERKDYAKKAISIIRRLQESMDAIHASGYYYGDLNPRNVLVDDDGNVSLIDWEQAGEHGPYPGQVGTPGFLAQKGSTGKQQDHFALYRCLLYLFQPIVDVIDLLPKMEHEVEKFIAQVYGEDVLKEVLEFRPNLQPKQQEKKLLRHETKNALPVLPSAPAVVRGAQYIREQYDWPAPPVSAYQFHSELAYSLWGGIAGYTAAVRKCGNPDIQAEKYVYESANIQQHQMSSGLLGGVGGLAIAATEAGASCAPTLQHRLYEVVSNRQVDEKYFSGHLYDGAAGDLASLLLLNEYNKSEDLAQQGLSLAEQLCAYLERTQTPIKQAGMARGCSGDAVALIMAGKKYCRTDFFDAAYKAIQRDINQCEIFGSERALQVRDRNRFLSYLGWGSAGIALAAQYLHRVRPDDSLCEWISQIARGLSSGVYICAGLMMGRTGIQLTNEYLDESLLEYPKQELRELHQSGLRMYYGSYEGKCFAVGDRNMKFAYDYAQGGGGAVLLTHMDKHDPLPWLPFSATVGF